MHHAREQWHILAPFDVLTCFTLEMGDRPLCNLIITEIFKRNTNAKFTILESHGWWGRRRRRRRRKASPGKGYYFHKKHTHLLQYYDT